MEVVCFVQVNNFEMEEYYAEAQKYLFPKMLAYIYMQNENERTIFCEEKNLA